MGAKIPFSVSARAGKLLGRENFSNPEGAIIELVKNAYDADAKNCLVVFDIPYEIKKDEKGKEFKHLLMESGRIFIIDNGEGMTEKVISEQWMKIGTGNKELDSVSKGSRVKTGAKGIGRFALDRLGYNADMWTLPKGAKNADGFSWKMDWRQFDESDKSISDITADVDSVKVEPLKIVSDEFNGNKTLLDFAEHIDFGNGGTILKITNLKDQWFDDEIADVFKSLEALIPPRELNIPFNVVLHHVQNVKDFGNVETAFFNDYDYKLKAKYDAKKLEVDFEITRNELDVDKLRRNFADLYKDAKPPYDLSTIENKVFSYKKPIDKLLKWELNDKSEQLLKDVGSFNLTFYYLKFNVSLKEDYPYKSLNTRERKSILDKFGGVKIYRDSFRVRPYGDPTNDWLKLGARVAQSPAGAGQRIGDWRVRPEQTAGIITISRNENPFLIDKSDRGSLQENDVYDVFRIIIIQVIHEFEVDRSRILNVLYKQFELRKKEATDKEIQKRAELLADRIVLERKKAEEVVYGGVVKKKDLFSEKKEEEEKKAYENAFIETFRKIEDEKVEKDSEELVQVRGLASLGLIMSSFAHELKEVRNNTGDIKSLEKIFRSLVPKEKTKLVEFGDGMDILELLKINAEKIKHWINYSLTAIKVDKRKRGKLDFSEYLASLGKTWKKIFESKDIQLEVVEDQAGTSYDFRGFEMDMDTIFTNLINNSIDAFNNLDDVQERKISIQYALREGELEVVYADNGPGLSKVFANREDIFLPFTTSKKDRTGKDIGTGLGMYLVKNVVDDYHGNIAIIDIQKGFSIKIAFPVRKN